MKNVWIIATVLYTLMVLYMGFSIGEIQQEKNIISSCIEQKEYDLSISNGKLHCNVDGRKVMSN